MVYLQILLQKYGTNQCIIMHWLNHKCALSSSLSVTKSSTFLYNKVSKRDHSYFRNQQKMFLLILKDLNLLGQCQPVTLGHPYIPI